MTTRCESPMEASLFRRSGLLVEALAVLGFLMTPVAVLAGVLGAWRFGADPGWTSGFFITDGWLSRYQFWFAVAICGQSSSFILKRWVAKQYVDVRAIAQEKRTIMKSMEREHLRCTLKAGQTELEHLLSNREAIVVDSSADVLDQIQRTSERDIAIGNLERESERLHQVRAALRRIDLGTYGICLDCNEEISIQRLAALPWTASCLICSEAADGNRPLTQSTLDRPLLTVTCPST